MADTSTMHDLRNGESNEPEGAARSEEVADHSEQTAEAVAEDEALALVLQPAEDPRADETGADDRGDEAERRGDGDESGVVADVGEVEDHDGHLAIGTEADHEEAEGDDDGVFVLEEGGKLLLHRDLDLMLRRLDHFLDLIGRPEERWQTDDDTDDDGQQIAARGLRGAVAHAGEEHDQGDCNQAGPARADVGEDHAQAGQLGAFAGIGRQNAVQRAEGHITAGGENGDQQVGDPHVDHFEGVAPGSLHG